MYANNQWTLDGFFRLSVGHIAEVRLLTYYDSPVPTIGAKVNLMKDDGYRPGIALKADITGGQFTDYRVAIMQKITNDLSASINFGAAANLGQSDRFYGVLALGYSFAEKFGAYIEGYFEQHYNQFNAGLTYGLNSETQLDINTGLMNGKDMYVMAGFARRIVFKKAD